MTRLRCAILDDYFNLALDVADWQKLSDRVDVTVFSHPFASEQAAASALADFEIICAMRERTAFPKSLFDVAAEAEAAADLRHAQRLDRHGGCEGARRRHRRHAILPRSDRAAHHGPDPGTDPRHRPRERAHACGRALADLCRCRDRGTDARRRRARQARQQDGGYREGVRHERDRLEPEPDAGEVRGRPASATPPRRSCSPRPISSPSMWC